MKQLLNIQDNKKIRIMIVFSMLFSFGLPFCSFASDITDTYYIGKAVNSGDGDGYSKVNLINTEDVHYGWDIGKFYIGGFSDIKSEGGHPAFISSGGVTLNFTLEENIDKLNGQENLSIAEDKKGHHKDFGINETNFGRGTLIVKYTDPQEKVSIPILHTDYLTTIKMNENSKVAYLDEGKYEVSFNYRVKDASNLLGLFPSYNDYSINFQFYVSSEENEDESEDTSEPAEGTSSGDGEKGGGKVTVFTKASTPKSTPKSSSSIGRAANNGGKLISLIPFLAVSIGLIFLLFRDRK